MLSSDEIKKARAKLLRRKQEKGNRIPDDLRDRIVREYAAEDGATTHTLGAKYQISATTVSNILREATGQKKRGTRRESRTTPEADPRAA